MLSVLTSPKWPLEAKDCNRQANTCPNWEFQRLNDEVEEAEATYLIEEGD